MPFLPFEMLCFKSSYPTQIPTLSSNAWGPYCSPCPSFGFIMACIPVCSCFIDFLFISSMKKFHKSRDHILHVAINLA